ncbi:uncharacterized protein LOC123430446 [Hordeum vulgare subsp. vulgare]|uniref:C2H2-type domain-containing protein n=1 Tax=Hordeum vulgare subsp. vulgare TaxID=112509 RepID=A0A8I7B4E7_HORVV|nr:uncharacterized protein LOC123430446 [Hordeum vulgare subsp. vulgare]
MALSTLLLPSSSSTADASDRRRGQPQQPNHHSKRKKKPPAPPPLSPAPRTPARRAGAGSTPKKSPALAAPTTGAKARLVAGKDQHGRHRRGGSSKKAPARPASSWEQLKSLLSCRSATAAARVHDPAALARGPGAGGYWGTSLCSMRDVATVDGASSAASVVVDHRDTAPLNRSSRRAHHSSSSSSAGGGGGHPSSLRGLSGCYECRAINVEPVSRRYPRPRELCPCSQCGEVFTKPDTLEHHQAVRHAVSELGPEDSGRNIVEIIFKSSWQKRDRPICHIDRILKVRNPPRTVARFEAYRDAVRARCRADAAVSAGGATRAAADGNELLRFHPAALACELGADGSTSLCASCEDGDAADGKAAAAACGVCAAIRHGFAPWAGAHPLGVRTTASSGRAHDVCGAEAATGAGWRAMLVCRVIAGQVRRKDGDGEGEEEEEGQAGAFDSVAGDDAGGAYGVLEELFVANPRAILPCFVVVYRVDADAQ